MELRQNQSQEIKYYQQVTQCGKPHCKKCREGTGHGPYWYAYRTVNGRTVRTYIGKHLPAEILATLPSSPPSLPSANTPSPPLTDAPSPPSAEPRVEAVRAPDLAQEINSQILRISVLGQFRLERRDGADGKWQTITDAALRHQRIRATLACLLSSPKRMIGREQLMDRLWDDLDLEVASARLDRIVYDLRWMFEPGRSRSSASSLLFTSHDLLALAGQSQIWVDADAFEEIIGQVYDASNHVEKEHLIEQATSLYGGDYFPDIFLKGRENENERNERTLEEVSARRELLQRSWLGLLLDLADLRIARGALRGALSPLQQVVSTDPTNEAAVQRLMKLFAQMGQRSEALRIYKRLAAVLQQEYHIVPLPETRAIYESLHEDSGMARSSSNLLGRTPSTIPSRAGHDVRSVAPFTVPIGRNHQSPLMGREEELRFLRSMVVETEHAARLKLQGQKKIVMPFDAVSVSQGVLLSGEIGIGKTRLAEEVAREAQQRGWAVIWSRTYVQENNIPYRLWIEVLRQIITQEIADKPVGWLRQEVCKRPLIFQPLGVLLPELYEQLPSVTLPLNLLPEQEQLRLWEAVYELFVFVSEYIPLFVVLDDLQWTDNRSCELLAYLLRRLQGYPITIVGTCRERELSPEHALYSLQTDLQREQALTTISLSPLSNEQINALVLHISSHISSDLMDISEALAERVRSRVAGNPFFAEELTRAVGNHLASHIHSGLPKNITRSFPQSFLHAVETALDIALPDTITAAIDLRLSQLSAECQRLLSKAAVLGGSFEFQAIYAIEATTPDTNEDAILVLLEEALDSGLLTEEGSGMHVTYQFWHPLLVSRLYEKTSATRRASLHRRAAEIFQRIYERHEEEGAAIITHHLVQGGGNSQKIAYFAELAGNRAYVLSSYIDAEQYYRLTLEHSAPHPDTQLHRAYLLEYIGECISVQGHGRYEEAREAYERALAIHKYYYPILSSEIQESLVQAILWIEIGVTWYDQAEFAHARHMYDQVEQMLRTLDLIETPSWAYLCLQQSYLAWQTGDLEEALLKGQEALLRLETLVWSQEGDQKKSELPAPRTRRTLAGHPVNLGRVYMLLGTVKVCMGKSSEGLTYYHTAANIYEQYNYLRELGLLWCNIGGSHLTRGEFMQADTALQRSLALARSLGEITMECFVQGNLGVLALRTGDFDTATMQIRRAIDLAERAQDKMGLSQWTFMLAYTLCEHEKVSEAAVILREAFTRRNFPRYSHYAILALLVLAVFRLAQAKQDRNVDKQRLLRAKGTLRHVLSFPGIEAEPKIEAQYLLAETMFLLGEANEAYDLALQALEVAQSENQWLVARIQRLLGNTLAVQKRYKQAKQYFEQALQTAQSRAMPQEYLWTQQAYQAIFQRKRKREE